MIPLYPVLLGISCIVFFPVETFADAPTKNGSYLVHFDQLEAMKSASPPVAMNPKYPSFENEEEIAFAQDSKEGLPSEQSIHNKLQGIQQEVHELRAQLEKQVQDLKLLQQQQITFYKDLDARLQSYNQANKGTTPDSGIVQEQQATLTADRPVAKLEIEKLEKATPLESQNVSSSLAFKNHIYSANEQISYLAAYDLLKNKRFDEALSAMKIFTVQYPQGGYTANAQYWLGELYMVKNNYVKAIEHFEMVLKKFPLSSKRAASTLKIGYALAASGKIEEAKVRLEEVLRNYPDTPTAQLATTKLESLGVS